MDLRNLDNDTRRHIVAEVQSDIGKGTLYLSPRLSEQGQRDYAGLLLKAAKAGTPGSFRDELNAHGRLNETETATRNGKTFSKKVPHTAAETLAEGEFNRFYARGLCLRANEDGPGKVRVYRAKQVTNPRSKSEALLGTEIDAGTLLDDLRTNVGVEPALGLPPGPNSGLSIQLTS